MLDSKPKFTKRDVIEIVPPGIVSNARFDGYIVIVLEQDAVSGLMSFCLYICIVDLMES